MESVPTSPKDPGPAAEWPVPGSDLTIHRAVMAVLWTIVIMIALLASSVIWFKGSSPALDGSRL